MDTVLRIAKALSDKNRLRVLIALAERKELCLCQITALLNLAAPTVSRHMGLLMNSGLVTSRRDGRWTHYALANKVPDNLMAWLRISLASTPETSSDTARLAEILSQSPDGLCTKLKLDRKNSCRKRIKVLFLCTGNSCRSQMAEGWTRHLKGDRIEAFSAGIETHGLNQQAVKVMAEAGVDISSHYSKNVASLMHIPFDYVVTVCGHASETCPFFPGDAKILHVGFDDPPRLAREAKDAGEALDIFRRVRDEIRAFVETLPEALQNANL